MDKTIVDFDAMKLTAEENRLALRFFDKLMRSGWAEEREVTTATGVALCVALTEFLGTGMQAGLIAGYLTQERARILVSALTGLLPRAS